MGLTWMPSIHQRIYIYICIIYTHIYPSIITWLITPPIHLPIYTPIHKTITIRWIGRKLYASNTTRFYYACFSYAKYLYECMTFPVFFFSSNELRWLWVQVFLWPLQICMPYLKRNIQMASQNGHLLITHRLRVILETNLRNNVLVRYFTH